MSHHNNECSSSHGASDFCHGGSGLDSNLVWKRLNKLFKRRVWKGRININVYTPTYTISLWPFPNSCVLN